MRLRFYISRACFSFLLLLLAAVNVQAQEVSGRVLAADTRKPVALASVFFSNTSYGRVTTSEGIFEFTNLPAGTYDMVISCVGYETQVFSVNTRAANPPFEVLLKPKVEELQSVVVEPYEKDNWERWGRLFLELFIGKSEFAANCTIRNTKAIQFRNYRRSRRLVAIANEPLIIENKALGYRVQYQLENFEYHFGKPLLFYTGYALFEERKGNTRQQERWRKNRATCYYGSVNHFFRSIYLNKLPENSFEVRRLVKVPRNSPLADSLQPVPDASADRGMKTQITIVSPDGNRKMSLPGQDSMDVVSRTLLTGDSLAFGIDAQTAGFYFENRLYITYTGAAEPSAYASEQNRWPPLNRQISQMQMLVKEPLQVYANGSVNNPTGVLIYGYWAFWEKLATLLPLDYEPGD